MRPFDSTNTPALRTGLGAAFTVLLFAASLFGAAAAFAFSISDSDFNDADWTSFVYFQDGAGGTISGSQTVSAGNPAPAYDVDLTINPAPSSSVYAFHRYEPATYDPTVEGALVGLDVAIEGQIPSTAGTPQTLRFGIEQNGVVYETFFAALVNLAAFTNIALVDLDSADFFGRDVGGGAQPLLDFSATAAPMSFGFVTLAGTGASPFGITARAVYDNFSVSTAVPEPQTGALLTLGLAFLGAACSRGSQRTRH